MIQKLLLIVSLLILSFSATAEVLTMKGEVFDLKGEKKFFEFQRYVGGSDKNLALKNLFKDLSGNVVVEESAALEDGSLRLYRVEQKQTGESGQITIEGEKISFIYRKKDGSLVKETENLEGNFIVGMTLVSHLKKNWDKLVNGDSLRTRLGVWHRAETVGFKFWKDSEKKVDGKEVMTVVMKPTSFVIRALVDPLHFTFDKKTRELLTIKGRTSPKIHRDGKWKEFDAFISYSKVGN